MNKKANGEEIGIIGIAIFILLFMAIIFFSLYKHKQLEHKTYIEIIDGLSDADRCLYQCGFVYSDSIALENYKFCAEKCEIIHEQNCIEENE